jgi:hypothetical protein
MIRRGLALIYIILQLDRRTWEVLNFGKPSADFSDRPWQGWQLAGFEVDANGFGHHRDGIMAALFEGAEDTHEDRLGLGSVLAAVGVYSARPNVSQIVDGR